MKVSTTKAAESLRHLLSQMPRHLRIKNRDVVTTLAQYFALDDDFFADGRAKMWGPGGSRAHEKAKKVSKMVVEVAFRNEVPYATTLAEAAQILETKEKTLAGKLKRNQGIVHGVSPDERVVAIRKII